jgi:hypothetical protein
MAVIIIIIMIIVIINVSTVHYWALTTLQLLNPTLSR